MAPAGEMWGIATYFNATGSPWLPANLRRFCAGVRRQGLKLLIVELAPDGGRYEVADELCDLVVRRRGASLLWQKERLLNLGIAELPPECDSVVWLDADVVFERDDWVAATRQRLETCAAVQPFESACWLGPYESGAPREMAPGLGEGKTQRGMAATLADHPNRRRALADHFLHGHPGFAWAIRREVIERHGFYDRAVLGGGDTIQGHALYGDADFWRGRNFYSRELTRHELSAVAEWSAPLADDVSGRIGWVPGRVLHLFHGEMARRRYVERLQILKENDYDPRADIALDPSGCWRWSSEKPALHAAVAAYFAQRSAP